MHRYANYATAGVAVGVVGAALGSYLWFSAKPSRADRAAAFVPWFGIGSAGVSGRF
jgi:hypothetical protein